MLVVGRSRRLRRKRYPEQRELAAVGLFRMLDNHPPVNRDRPDVATVGEGIAGVAWSGLPAADRVSSRRVQAPDLREVVAVLGATCVRLECSTSSSAATRRLIEVCATCSSGAVA